MAPRVIQKRAHQLNNLSTTLAMHFLARFKVPEITLKAPHSLGPWRTGYCSGKLPSHGGHLRRTSALSSRQQKLGWQQSMTGPSLGWHHGYRTPSPEMFTWPPHKTFTEGKARQNNSEGHLLSSEFSPSWSCWILCSYPFPHRSAAI